MKKNLWKPHPEAKNPPEQTFATPEQFELWQKMKAGDLKAKNELIKLNTGLINRWVRPYRNPSYVDDLRQAGRLAMSDSLRRFDPSLGFKFSTFVNKNIRQAIRREANRNRYGHNIPHLSQVKYRALIKLENDLTMLLSRHPTEEEINNASIFDAKEIEYLKSFKNEKHNYLSLSDSVKPNSNSESDRTWDDVLSDKKTIDP